MNALKEYAIRLNYLTISPNNDVQIANEGKLVYVSIVFLLLLFILSAHSFFVSFFSKTYR
jgi:hypothetical protein